MKKIKIKNIRTAQNFFPNKISVSQLKLIKGGEDIIIIDTAVVD